MPIHIADYVCRKQFMLPTRAARLLNSLKGVAERTVTKIVKQRGDDGYLRAVFVSLECIRRHLPPNDIDQLSGCVENSDGMRETSMGRAWKDEFSHPELPDAAKALKFRRSDQGPRKLIQCLIVLEYDQAVHRIA